MTETQALDFTATTKEHLFLTARSLGILAVGVSMGIRVHGQGLIARFCGEALQMTADCSSAVFLTNRLSIAAAVVGIVLMAIGLAPSWAGVEVE